MTTSPARILSSALQGGFSSKFHVLAEWCPASYKCCASWLPRPIMAFFHVLHECEKPGYFYTLPPSCVNKLPIKRGEDLYPNHTILLPRVFIEAPLTKIHSIMDSRRGSSSRAPSPQPGDWWRCSVPHSELATLQTEGYLPPAFMVRFEPDWPPSGGGKQAESVPNPSKGERVCFVPYLIRGLGFPIHPFLRGLLEFYGLQLHHLTPASILHIAGFVALCKLFLGIEAHFAL